MAPRRKGPTAESKARAERIAAALSGLLEDPPPPSDSKGPPPESDPYRPFPRAPHKRPPAGLRCPGCGAPMDSIYSRGVAIDRCSSCFGMWLDPGELDEMLEDNPTPPQADLGRLRTEMSTMPGTQASQKIRYRKCPHCSEPMDRRNFGTISGVVIDECPRHGVFLDPEELDAIDRFIQLGGKDLEQLSKDERQQRKARHAHEMQLERDREEAREYGRRAGRRVWWTFFSWY